MKIKVISDLHFGRGKAVDLWNEIQEEFISTINDDLDLLVIAGDYFDRVLKMDEPASKYAMKLMDQLIDLSKLNNFKIRIIKGTKSHDFNQLDHFKKFDDGITDKFLIIENCSVEELKYNDSIVKILYIPEEYVTSMSYYDKFFNVKEKYDLVFFHGTMSFAGFTKFLNNVGGGSPKIAPTFNSEELASISYGPVVGGHIHIKDSYKNKIFYTGSFSRYNFGEEKEKGFIDIDYNTDTKDYKTKFIENKLAPTYVTINSSDLDGTLEEKLKNIEELKEEYDYIRVNISESDRKGNEKIIDTMKNIVSDNVKIKIKNTFEEEYDEKYSFIIKRELPLNETIQKYINMTKNKSLSLDKINSLISKED